MIYVFYLKIALLAVLKCLRLIFQYLLQNYKIISLNFKLIDLKVETKKHSKLGKVSSFTLDPDSFIIQQIIVKRPTLKSFLDPELTISRKEIVEITDDKIIVKDEEKVLKKRAEKEDFIPNLVNPFRGQNLAQIETDKEEKETN